MKWKIVWAPALGALLVGGLIMSQVNATESKTDNLRVAFPYAQSAGAYDPAKIHLAPEYIFLENTFSSLVEMNPETGQVESGIAETYRWVGTALHLKIRDNLKTVDGLKITAADAEFSLKRLLSLPGNTHGDFQELICGVKEGQSVEDYCDGIQVIGNELILKTTQAGKTFLLPMLVTADFSIIPKSSVDPVTMKIVDFRNTSGPYYVSKDSATGEIELKANPNHYHYSKAMPQEVNLVPTDRNNPHASVEDFKNGRFDFITTIDAARADDVIAFSRTQADAVLHTTMNIRSFILLFSQRGQDELSPAVRFAIGQKIREALTKKFAGTNGIEASKQFFPVFGEAALSKDKIEKIDELFKTPTEIPHIKLKITLIRLGDTSKFIEAIKSVLPDAEVTEAPKNPNFIKYDKTDDMPHMAITGPDTGFQEDIGLITYSLNAGYFGMDKEGRRQWLKAYMDTPDKSKRIEKLKELHEKTLRAPITIPLLIAPYAAIMRKPWKGGLSQLFANTHLWLIRKD
jgi:ABC-type oligopeptide transport system substrate-binding subunit